MSPAVPNGRSRTGSAAGGSLACGPVRPRIVARAEWGARAPRAEPRLGRVELIVLHHTTDGHRRPPSGASGVLREIQALHMDANGWADLGYNLLVDRQGRVYEGRAGGPHRAVVGAHARGANARSTGIAVIGDFSRQPPPEAALAALVRLLAWKLSVHGLSARGDTIVGHREVGETQCPGSALDGRLPELRRRVAARIATG